ncbi:hypothetical protein RHMOL_Rhmol13G0145200 [Rhododendron molle]|uniref:Uncharacterized protein n=1 Tax=Rhododendron molle TaxID=49168 RepID=A0ACC0L824_RHOML|nr:hypothetical protein RHMOL_Rhmol13G0145200 [Rhododendron molle]
MLSSPVTDLIVGVPIPDHHDPERERSGFYCVWLVALILFIEDLLSSGNNKSPQLTSLKYSTGAVFSRLWISSPPNSSNCLELETVLFFLKREEKFIVSDLLGLACNKLHPVACGFAFIYHRKIGLYINTHTYFHNSNRHFCHHRCCRRIFFSSSSGRICFKDDSFIVFRAIMGCLSFKPDYQSLAAILKSCAVTADTTLGKSLHTHIIKLGHASCHLVSKALLNMYAESHALDDSRKLSVTIAIQDVVSWNEMIVGFAENNCVDEAFDTFRWMLEGPTTPNYATIANILPVCGLLEESVGYHFGREIHCHVLRRAELVADLSIVNALVRFYTRIGRMGEAESVFQRMRVRDLVSWNTIISGYTSNSEWLKALELFHELISVGRVELDSVTLLGILPACANLCHFLLGKQIHGYVIQHPQLNEDTSVGNALLSFNAKCGAIEAAFRAFSSIYSRDLISWNSMLHAFADRNLQSPFFELIHWMLEESIKPDSVTILAIIQFCATLSRVDKVKGAHGVSIKSGFLLGNGTPTLGNAVMDAYAKCGSMKYASKIFETSSGKRNVVTCNSIISGYVRSGSTNDAHRIFHYMPERDLTTWNLMIRAYAKNDCPSQALSLFHELKDYGVKPDALTLMSLLPICAQMASIQFLRQCHGYAVRACFKDVHLNAALIDVYSKCGNIDSAYKLFQSTHRKDVVIFTAMVGGYAMHGKGEEALGVFSHVLELGEKLDHVTITVVLSVCSHTGLINEGLKIFDSLEKRQGIKPTKEQYACVVDLLARGGRIKDVYSLATEMPFEANASVWIERKRRDKVHAQSDIGNLISEGFFHQMVEDLSNLVIVIKRIAPRVNKMSVAEIRMLSKKNSLLPKCGCRGVKYSPTLSLSPGLSLSLDSSPSLSYSSIKTQPPTSKPIHINLQSIIYTRVGARSSLVGAWRRCIALGVNFEKLGPDLSLGLLSNFEKSSRTGLVSIPFGIDIDTLVFQTQKIIWYRYPCVWNISWSIGIDTILLGIDTCFLWTVFDVLFHASPC